MSTPLKDKEGFLVHLEDWTPDVALAIAAEDGLVLSKEHWAIIVFLRQFYLQHEKTPGIRVLVKHLSEILQDPQKGNSLYLHQLFPKGPARQASKIAGLPKPARCL